MYRWTNNLKCQCKFLDSSKAEKKNHWKLIATPVLWNEVPPEIWMASNLLVFWRDLKKTWLFVEAFGEGNYSPLDWVGFFFFHFYPALVTFPIFDLLFTLVIAFTLFMSHPEFLGGKQHTNLINVYFI